MRALFLIAAVALAGCTDHGKCLKEHTELLMQPMYMTTCNGTTCTMQIVGVIPQYIPVCDQWEFPDGRPAADKK